MSYVVVESDPAIIEEGLDDTGIIVAGKSVDRKVHVLEDLKAGSEILSLT